LTDKLHEVQKQQTDNKGVIDEKETKFEENLSRALQAVEEQCKTLEFWSDIQEDDDKVEEPEEVKKS
jgi:hypothetical protein